MKQPKGFVEYGKQGCCPHEWDHVPDVTGYYEMDGSIARCRNKDMQSRLEAHLVTDVAYKRGSNYGRGPI